MKKVVKVSYWVDFWVKLITSMLWGGPIIVYLIRTFGIPGYLVFGLIYFSYFITSAIVELAWKKRI